MVDIRGNLAIAIIVASAGAALVRSMKPPTSTVARRRWLPAIAFISGPMFTVGWSIVEIYVSKYTHPDDVVPMIVSMAAIGLVAGAIGAMAFWIAER